MYCSVLLLDKAKFDEKLHPPSRVPENSLSVTIRGLGGVAIALSPVAG